MKIEIENSSKLAFFQALYREARSFAENKYEKLQQHIEQYKGSPNIDDSNEEQYSVKLTIPIKND